ncbi:MAG TPA: helix-hairpin-helix domain-containing protein [Dinghuibacter sp.]|uniref:helix-hairpin-helix domain-containing protein n=1 Tax=Dinghuibacter sp. TaxID=2024697 RepID=UPI002B605E81|nr:helix-hairpin-helix domain-containing protein [Dinghuibacter sp.]HTJ13047.1 helix-hairpin-helix domain-containing protein [Dinghuibacter sp.]
MDNQAIADSFSLTAKLMEIHGENSFKAKGYSIAAYNIERMTQQLEEIEHAQLFAIKGIGDTMGKKIIELNTTGEMAVLKELLERTPAGVMDMMQVKGVGPKKVSLLWKELGIESLGELLYACDENRLTLYKGFGAKTQANIKENIEFILKNQDRFLWAHIEPFALEVEKAVQDAFPDEKTALSGAFRRQMEIIDELEFVTTVGLEELADFLESQDFELEEDPSGALIARGAKNLPLVWHVSDRGDFGSQLFISSASEEFLKAWGPVGAAAKEEEIFARKGVAFVVAPRREKFPVRDAQIIQPTDIKGIIHSHSDWSDGAHTLEKMAATARAQGLEYLVISDHSKTAFYANGLTEERIQAQHELIASLNAKLAPFKIFRSIESDILNDGRLDYSDTTLATFDLVIASVHSNLGMPLEKAMQRLLTAIRNPFTTILGHPTGRLLLSRKGYPVDHRALLDACAAEGVVMELNAHPRRLDMDWRWLEDAMERGVLTSIDPDAHAIEGFADTRYGVLVAQKAGLTARQNLSSFSRVELERWLAERRVRKGI